MRVPQSRFLKDWFDESAQIINLAILLFFERLKGDRSFFKPYLDVLPRAFDSPMFWSDRQLAFFAYGGANVVRQLDADVVVVDRLMQVGDDVRNKLSLLDTVYRTQLAPFCVRHDLLALADDAASYVVVNDASAGEPFDLLRWAVGCVVRSAIQKTNSFVLSLAFIHSFIRAVVARLLGQRSARFGAARCRRVSVHRIDALTVVEPLPPARS